MTFAPRAERLKLPLLVFALLASALALLPLQYSMTRKVLDVVAFLDITGSMNVRDGVAGRSDTARLDASKAAVIQLAQTLPCGSRLGLGIFTERRSFLLFGPADTCEDYEPLKGAINEIDWRMAWEGDSYIARGLYDAVAIAHSLEANVAFFTDGHEAPPLPSSGIPDFEGKPGETRGLIVGVGGQEKLPIPKFDDDGREIGHYGPGDVPHVNRHGLPGKDMSSAVGWHPRNAPQGGDAVVGEEHLSALRTSYLMELAAHTGLKFSDLQSERDLAQALTDASSSRDVVMKSRAAIFPASAALLALMAIYFIAVFLGRMTATRRP